MENLPSHDPLKIMPLRGDSRPRPRPPRCAGYGHGLRTPPLCLNYEHREEFGSIFVDTRIPPDYTYVTWLWDIDDPTERAGYYEYSIWINGQRAEAMEFLKDDNLHSALPAATVQRTNWRRGDIFAIRAQHLSAGQNAIFAAVNNECVIP